jgi:hypothetical protein
VGDAEDGSASLEFITAGIVLLVPLVYLVLALSALQGAAFAVEGGARQAVRVFVQQEDEASARSAADRAIRAALADYGLEESSATVRIDCGRSCLAPRSAVSVDVEVAVPMPLMPSFLDVDVATAVPVSASATERVSRFAGVRD